MKFKILVLVLVLFNTGCVRVDAGNKLPTFGEQILDLVTAHESGVISDDEFRVLRGNLIRSFGR